MPWFICLRVFGYICKKRKKQHNFLITLLKTKQQHKIIFFPTAVCSISLLINLFFFSVFFSLANLCLNVIFKAYNADGVFVWSAEGEKQESWAQALNLKIPIKSSVEYPFETGQEMHF